MTITSILIILCGAIGAAAVHYLRRVALAIEGLAIDPDDTAPEQPTVQTRGLGGGGRLAK
jgi:hypothetical protein